MYKRISVKQISRELRGLRIHIFLYGLIFFLQGCVNSPKNIPFPENETEFSAPKKVKLKPPFVNDFNPAIIPLDKEHRPDSIIGPSETQLEEPILTGPEIKDSVIVVLKKQLIAKPNEVVLHNVKTKPCKPKIILLGDPVKVDGKPPVTSQKTSSNIKIFTSDQGLVASNITSIIKDRLNNLWMGTRDGLCKFDGRTWWIYTVKQGLSNNAILCIRERENGQLIIGTSGGGLDILDFKRQQILHYGVQQGLTDGVIWSMHENRKKEIFLGTHSGGLIALTDNGKKITVYSKDQGFPHEMIKCINETRNGDLLIGTNRSGAFIMKPLSAKALNYSAEHGLIDPGIRSFIETSSGELVMGCRYAYLYVINPKTNTLRIFDTRTSPFNYMHSINESPDGVFSLAMYDGGFAMVKFSHPDTLHIKSFNSQNGLSSNQVYKVIDGPNGELFLGTGNGFNILMDNEFYDRQQISFYNSFKNFSGAALQDFDVSADGRWLLPTFDSKLCILSKERNKQQSLIYYPNVTSGFEDRLYGARWTGDNNVVMASRSSGVYFLNPKTHSLRVYGKQQGLKYLVIRSLAVHPNGEVLAGAEGSLYIFDKSYSKITVVDTTNGLKDSRILGLFIDKHENILIATYGGGLSIIDAQRKTLKTFTTKSGLSNNFLWCVYKNRKGEIFLGTQGNGLNVIDPKGQYVTCYGQEQGLPFDRVDAILEDSLGNMWIGTSKGICQMVPKGNGYEVKRTLTKSTGLKHENCSYLKLSGKDILASIGGIPTCFNPYLRTDSSQCPIYISGIRVSENKESWFTSSRILEKSGMNDTIWSQGSDTFYIKTKPTDTSYYAKNSITYSGVNDDLYHLPQNLVLPYSQNHLTFEYIGIAISAHSDKIRYRYILDGLDQKWNPITEKTEADYRNIPPGEYVFKVCARGLNGKWSKPVEFKFEVLSPWYQTRLAIGCYVLFLGLFIFGYNGWRTRKLKERQKELEKTVEERTSEVVLQKETIEQKQKEIIDSIQYARRIQRAQLPSIKYLTKVLDRLNKN